ncbi:MAG TPA: type II toxin-antitoxin system VapC family toxin [bacterium]|nr:type II toxin-antitoxin system VapC family toxin [bacterium]
MILLDANILLYAYNASDRRHERARPWLEQLLIQPEPIGFAWTTILAFLRLSTNPRVFEHPFLPEEAVPVVSSWIARPNAIILQPGERHWQILSNLLAETSARGALIMDAHLAALAIEHGAELATTDKDFARFPGLRALNPLVS